MKLIALINWLLLASYGILLAYSTLAMNPSNTDAAGRGLATAYLLFGFIVLAVLVGVNCLSFHVTRLGVFVLLLLPLLAGLVELIGQGFSARQTRLEEDGRFYGTYYFRDAQRRQIAQAIASRDLARVQTLLAQPVPVINGSGTDHVTLLDFAALRGGDSADGVIPYLSLLLAKGATIQTNDTLRSPTHALVSRDCPAWLLAWFLKHGADPNASRMQDKPTPILFAVMDYNKDRLEKIKLLLAHGADPNAVYPPTATGWLAGHPALLAAARLELWDVCQLLLECGADPAVTGPQRLVFRELIDRYAEIFAAGDDAPLTFKALIKYLNAPGSTNS
ncbi:ankyrin repeat domain-containing protein [Spirosoma fluminis]